MIRRLLYSSLVALVALFATAERGWCQGERSEYRQQDSARFRVFYGADDEGVLPEFWTTIHVRVPQVERRLGLALADTVTFVITPTPEEWFRLTAGSPLWANGLARPDQGVAFLKSPRFNMRYGRSLPVTAVHEYVHLLLKAGAPEAEIPRWLDEGLAQVLAEQQDYRDNALIGRSAAAGRLFTLSGIEGLMGMNAEAARLAYAQSEIAVSLLESRYGMPGIANLVHGLRSGRPFNETFRTVFGLSPGAFETEYHEHVRRKYRISFIADVDLWVGIAFVALLLAGGAAMYARRRRTLRKWEEEDRHSGGTPEGTTPPYTINYTLVRGRMSERIETLPPADPPPHDEPIPGN
ncbi:hypothetical protein KKH27_03555 [bacterium]|nr:hypothetical protein [bacterium]MBU1984022.1 hypothetical protein [bacterium]